MELVISAGYSTRHTDHADVHLSAVNVQLAISVAKEQLLLR
jgi:hypothetical protein